VELDVWRRVRTKAPVMRDGRWTAAAVEHDEAVGAFLDAMAGVPRTAWHRPRAQAKWSPAALASLRDRARTQPSFRCTHAYFGALRPWTTVRLLSAHTRHHAKGLLGPR
jgi:hypothetical protein